MISSASTSDSPFSDAIQRVLFIASNVHVYKIPPLTSTKGYLAAHWTADSNKRQIFTARLRVLETAIPDSDGGESLSTEILLEDPATGQLFAGAPYTDAGAVEAALDSGRFFAVRVVGDGGRKAVLGIGFEERGEAIDFGITLQEARKVQGIEVEAGRKGMTWKKVAEKELTKEKKDFSLKEGETIHVAVGKRGRRKEEEGIMNSYEDKALGTFSIAPPPPYSLKAEVGGMMPLLPPPPSVLDVKTQRRRSRQDVPAHAASASDLGFDDGEFGEFQ
ncbi:hypothetical protein MMC07_003652 [Pseudocyphellaria aurata]|nr:hypothetical protein [Pseudocyphellaria aurata]